jgi:UDP-glucose 4-epimerase
MKAIVTGAAGFIGSHVAEKLIRDGHEVLAIDDLSGGFRENVPEGARFEKRSVVDPLDDLFKAFKPEAVYHLAAYAAEGLSHHIPVFNYTNNVVGTVNVAAASYRAGVRHIVFTSSIAAYGHPHSSEPFDEATPCVPCDPYGTAKLACEQHLKAAFDYYGGPAYTIFRPHNVFGPRQNVSDPYRNVVGIFMLKALQGAPMPVFGDGSQTRSFSEVSTVAHCIADAPLVPAARNATINVGGDEAMSVKELAAQISRVMGAPERIDFLPPRKEVMHAHCKHDLARRTFPKAYANPVGIAEGLARMADFVRSRPVPPVTECPSPIEISDLLPPSWKARLGV